MSILNKTVSYFPGITATKQGVDMNLLTLLQSNKHKEIILCLRQSDGAEQKQLKEKLPCYTVAGTFSRRCDDGITQPSGLAAVDLDSAEDYDVIHLLNELKKIDCIAYAGLSCRGKRLFCIVPFKFPDKYVKHYERLIKSFNDLGLPMGDDCHKRISQPRFVSWNDDGTQFFNHDAKPYYLLPAEKIYFTVKQNYQHTGANATPDNPFKWCVEQINKSYSYSEGTRHDYIIHIARYCNMKGLPESETLQGCAGFAQTDFSEIEIKNIVKHIYSAQNESHAKLPFKTKETIQQKFVPTQQQQIFEQPKENTDVPELKPVEKINYFTGAEPPKLESWEQEINVLEKFFESIKMPTQPIKLNQCSTITNVFLFLESHFAIVKAQNGKRTFLPYLHRLQELKKILIINLN